MSSFTEIINNELYPKFDKYIMEGTFEDQVEEDKSEIRETGTQVD